MLIGFAVTVMLARYLGPETYGVLAYSVSLVGLFTIAGHMGLSGLLVKELVRKPYHINETLGTGALLKAVGYLLGFISLVVFTFQTEQFGSTSFWVLMILSFGILFKPFDVIDYWFQSRLEAKYPAISKAMAISLGSVIKLLLIYFGANVVMFAVANLLQATLFIFALVIFYKVRAEWKLSAWRVSLKRAKTLLKEGYLVFIGSILAVVYLKIDQVMLRWLGNGHHDVGIYSVAVAISEAWYFVPVAIVASFFPRLIKLRDSDNKKYNDRFQQLFDLLFIIALVAAVFTTIIAEPLINFFFGDEYYGASTILTIHVWAALFVFMRTAFSRWILIENVFLFSVITQGAGAISNVILNWYLIPVYGGVGAAYATLISYASASFLALLFSVRTRPIFKMMSLAMISPVRYAFRYKSHP